MKKLIYIIALIALVISCTPQRRLERLLRKHPELTSIDSITLESSESGPKPKFCTVEQKKAVTGAFIAEAI